MSAEEFFRSGRLEQATAAQSEAVRARPLDQDARWWLFVLLVFAGELERAEKQLDVLSKQDEGALRGGLVYRGLLASELERRRVFDGASSPVLPPDAPEYARLRVEALRALARGDDDAAAASVAAAVEVTPQVTGSVNGRPVGGLCDYDDRLGGVLEVFAGGRYLWLPLDFVERLEVAPPQTAIDALWRAAELTDREGETAQVFLPSLYPGTHTEADEALRLGRATQWREQGTLQIGTGQRVLLGDCAGELEEFPMLSLQRFELGA